MIISDILDLSKVEAGRLEVESAPFSLMDLLQSLQTAYGSLADSRDLDFQMDLGPRVPDMVMGDALRVRQILSNFLHNALKFTPAGAVQMTVRKAAGERVRFEVRDTGPGIDEATQERLFKPFTQADESITRRFGGTGLGLSICKELAALMEGDVGMQSAPGQGSRFWAEVPVERSVSAGRPFDAVLMDVQMPGMSGHEATRRLRKRWTKAQLPIIALTAAALVSEREQAMASGMNDFVTKPIEPNRLRQALLRALAKDD